MANILECTSARLQRVASPMALFSLMGVMAVLGYFMVSSVSPSQELMTLANGKNVPDAQFWRSEEGLYQQLEDYGAFGRHLYLTRVSPLDIFIPLAQAMVLSVTLSLVFRNALARESKWQRLNLLPFIAMGGDYLENLSIITLMLAFPNRIEVLVFAASVFTALKWIFTIISLLVIGGGIGILLTKRLRSFSKKQRL